MLLWKHIRALTFHFQCKTCTSRAQPSRSAPPQSRHYARIDFIRFNFTPLSVFISHAHLAARFHPPPPFGDWSHTPFVLCRPTDRTVPESRERGCSGNSLFSSHVQKLFHLEKSGSALSERFARKGNRQLRNVTAQAVGGLIWHHANTLLFIYFKCIYTELIIFSIP